MKSSTKERVLKLILFSIIISLFLVFCNFTLISSLTNNKNRNPIDFSDKLLYSQINSNFSVNCEVPKLIWFEGHVDIIIKANQSGTVNVEITDSMGNIYFSPISTTISLNGGGETQRFSFKTAALFLTFPGQYQFTITLSGLFSFSQTYDSVLGMGYLLLLILLMIFILPLVYILSRRTEKSTKSYVDSQPESIEYATSEGVESGKIRCPKCRKIIQEGLAFCPECGSRIPEFLRFNPNSSSGIS